MALRGTRLPSASWRNPVSIGCWMRMRTSTTSPRRASGGIWMRESATLAAVGAGGFPHLDVDRVGPEAAVGELDDGQHALRAVQAHARAELGAARMRAEPEARHLAHRVFPGKEV